MTDKREAGRDQKDVLAKKDGVTKSGRGLQVWEDPAGGKPARGGQSGEASQGTAERAATLADEQEKGGSKEGG